MPQQTTAAYVKSLNILFLALLAGQILFAAIIFLLHAFTNMNTMLPAETQLFIYIGAAVIFICIMLNQSLFKKRIESIQQLPVLATKLNAYRALYIMRFALAEVPVLLAIILIFLTGNQIIWVFVVTGIVYGITLKHSKERLIQELQLGSDDIDKLSDADGGIG